MEYQIRKAVLDYAKGIAKVHINSWKSTYKGIISDEFFSNLNIERGIERWKGNLKNPSEKYQVLIAVDDQQQIIGFIDGGQNRGEKDKYDAEVYSFYLLEEVQKQKIGSEVFGGKMLGRVISRGSFLWLERHQGVNQRNIIADQK